MSSHNPTSLPLSYYFAAFLSSFQMLYLPCSKITTT